MWDQDVIKNEVDAEGLPIGVQVVCAPYDEELCVDVMKQIAELKPFTHVPPCLASTK
jgi:Asp-tRNA(Asn)/Glu-tRNA(Gln) amidotransferase A subunit family amidase